MSSDLFPYDGSFYHHSSSDMASADIDLQFFSDIYFPFSDSHIEILEAISDGKNQQNPVENYHSLDPIVPLSSSPPSQQMENLSLYQTTHLQPFTNCSNSVNGFADFSGFDGLEVKTEECQIGYGFEPNFSSSYEPNFLPHSFNGTENVPKMMQRSYSSNTFDIKKPGFSYQPSFDCLMESPNFQNHDISSPENSFSTSHMRRVCSTGDLQSTKPSQTSHRSFSSPLASESSLMEESNFKVGRYSAEERKERIHRYRAKRTQRNFNKTIKYACRKTLADNRPRVRGRFARNDETSEIPKANYLIKDGEEDELWFNGLHEDDEEGIVRGGPFLTSFGPTQFQYYGF